MLDSFMAALQQELIAATNQAYETTARSYGAEAARVVQAINSRIMDDTPHWSGLLTMVGYQLEGGQDQPMILRAAWAMELTRVANTSSDCLTAQTATQQANLILANLPTASAAGRLTALSICARSSLLHAHGHMTDANFVNPMHVGMVLAAADCHGTDDITPFVKAMAEPSPQLMTIARSLTDRWPDSGLLVEVAEHRLSERI